MITFEFSFDGFSQLHEDLTPRRLSIAMHRAAKRLAAEMEKLAAGPTATWDTQPEFTSSFVVDADSGSASVGVSTDSAVYNWIDRGTPPHRIVAKRGRSLNFIAGPDGIFQPKTLPGSLMGYDLVYDGDEVVQAAYVNHPGIEAREFGPAVVYSIDQEYLYPIVVDEIQQAWNRQSRSSSKK